jgi:hypothetical protein
MERKLGDHHSGELKRESVEARAERIIAARLNRRHGREFDRELGAKSAPEKLALAARLRRKKPSRCRGFRPCCLWAPGRA